MKLYLTKEDVLSQTWEKNPKVRGDRAGVYMIRDKTTNDILYVGQTSNLRGRLCPSVHPVYISSKHDLYFLPVEDARERKYTESSAINFLHPRRNIRRGIEKTDQETTEGYYRAIFDK